MVETEEPDKKSVSLYLAQFYHLFKNEEASSSSTSITARTSRHFNRSRNELLEKYGEDIFNNSKNDDEDGGKLGKRAPLWDKLESSQTKKTNQNNDAQPTKFYSNRNSPSVASMCKHFENAKISAS